MNVAWLRSSIASAMLALVVPLLGASSGFAAPVVIVYPMTSTGGVDPAAGTNIAALFGSKLTQLGGVTVVAATPGTERARFLEAASANGADYYITGFLTPIGADSSLIAQVVSTRSGSVVYSTTATVRTYSDALAIVDALRAAILRHAGRGLAALDAPSPAPAPNRSSAASATSNTLDIGRALGKRNRGKPAPTPTPTTSAALASAVASPLATTASAPATFGLLFTVRGALDADETTQTMRALVDGFARAKRATALVNAPLARDLARAGALCSTHPGANELDDAALAIGKTASGAVRVQLDMTAFDCAGTVRKVRRASAIGRGRRALRDAIGRAASEATSALVGR